MFLQSDNFNQAFQPDLFPSRCFLYCVSSEEIFGHDTLVYCLRQYIKVGFTTMRAAAMICVLYLIGLHGNNNPKP